MEGNFDNINSRQTHTESKRKRIAVERVERNEMKKLFTPDYS